MTVYEKVKTARLRLGLSQSEAATRAGLEQKDLSLLETGKKKFIPEQYIQFLYNEGVDLNTLYDREDDVKLFSDLTALVEDSQNSPLLLKEPTIRYSLKTDRPLLGQSIPLYNTNAAAGLTQVFSGTPDIIDHISIPNLPKCDGAIYITGDSMYPLLKSGDIVAYKIIKDMINGIFWGQMYLISYLVDGDDYTMVKFIQKSEKGEEYIKLVSQNKHHDDSDVALRNVTALALIKASIRFNTMN